LRSISREAELRAYYETLFRTWGCQHWWPARNRFEVIVGAYLTQNTSWANVERALRSLKKAGFLTIDGIRRIPLPQLESLIRSSGYFRQKARRLKIFVQFLDEKYGGSLNRMFARPTKQLREELLALHGVGAETADSILLYAGQHPVFVVDAYTRRILDRHNILPSDAPYAEIRALFERALSDRALSKIDFDMNAGKASVTAHPPSAMSLAKRSPQAQVFNDMHGMIVGVGKRYCLKSQPKCDECPWQKFLPNLK